VKRILFCTDGEEHTAKAEDMAFDLACKYNAVLVGLYVLDPFLKKFTNEIYAINREACREHLDRQLLAEGEKALGELAERSRTKGTLFEAKIRYGSPEEEILKEIDQGAYDILIMGARLLKGWRQRLESVNLPRKILAVAPIPVLFVR
jgi:nucleotide-binding universal stress UspA family protein